MSLQSPAILSNTRLLKKQVVKICCMCVAGLIVVALLMVNPFNNNNKNTAAAKSISLNKQAPVSGSNCPEQKKQSSTSSSFSIMPGRLNRFLQ
ncbi:MAG TPA: hypothetical protein VG738_02180 [Chitinophagaceae bacterium]|nr:hypothetical protein [Chitinophagaceae bacterium]